MITLATVVFACLVVFTNANPTGLWAGAGHGVTVVPAGPTTLIGASGKVGPDGAAGPSGVVTGRGAVGPSGEHNAMDDHVVGAWAVPAHWDAPVATAWGKAAWASPAAAWGAPAGIWGKGTWGAPASWGAPAAAWGASVWDAPAIVQKSAVALAPAIHGKMW